MEDRDYEDHHQEDDNSDDEIQLNFNEECFCMKDEPKKKFPLPDECEDEISGIESIIECFKTRYKSVPKFHRGSLLDALENASSSDSIEEYPPVLVYLHHDKSIFSNPFWIKIFTSEEIIQYLNEKNYIVWPWDITFESNKTKFMTIWKERLPHIDITKDQCPMLIGILIRNWKPENSPLKRTYSYKVLLDSSKPQSQNENPKEHTLKILTEFETLVWNEQKLVFNFQDRTQFLNEIILEIAKYLTINDAVTVFGENIYSLFRNYDIKLQISHCSDWFIDEVLQKINPEKITSMRICRTASTSENISNILNKLPNITSIILINPSYIELSVDYKSYCPKLICFSVYYDEEFNIFELFDILRPITEEIKRLELHGSIRNRRHFDHQQPFELLKLGNSIEYLLLDIRSNHQSCIDRYFEDYFYFDMLCWPLIDTMTSIKYIHYITDELDRNTIIGDAKWINLFNSYHLLKKLIIEFYTTTKSGEKITEKVTKTRRDIPNN